MTNRSEFAAHVHLAASRAHRLTLQSTRAPRPSATRGPSSGFVVFLLSLAAVFALPFIL